MKDEIGRKAADTKKHFASSLKLSAIAVRRSLRNDMYMKRCERDGERGREKRYVSCKSKVQYASFPHMTSIVDISIAA